MASSEYASAGVLQPETCRSLHLWPRRVSAGVSSPDNIETFSAFKHILNINVAEDRCAVVGNITLCDGQVHGDDLCAGSEMTGNPCNRHA
jgi:hypothetical protein